MLEKKIISLILSYLILSCLVLPYIAYVVKYVYMERNARLSTYFHWIAKEVIYNHSMATKTIIHCQTLKQCAVVYLIYVVPRNAEQRFNTSG